MAGGVVVAGDGGGGARVKCEEWPFAGRSTIFSFCFFFLKSERIFVGSEHGAHSELGRGKFVFLLLVTIFFFEIYTFAIVTYTILHRI